MKHFYFESYNWIVVFIHWINVIYINSKFSRFSSYVWINCFFWLLEYRLASSVYHSSLQFLVFILPEINVSFWRLFRYFAAIVVNKQKFGNILMQSPRSSLSVLYIFKFEGNLKTFCLFAECNLPLKLIKCEQIKGRFFYQFWFWLSYYVTACLR
jgi:hypothetical protein